ncbi:MAG: sulfatase-like hydrolase/transferase [Eubacterium sp.]|nr:sulfatase-like hydrolase/transferase [Eubacterium sp.]
MKLLQKLSVFRINPEKRARLVALFNHYSLLIHMLLSMALCFTIEAISRHSVLKALSFFDEHTLAFAYNSFIIFASLSLVYLIRRRTFARFIICGFWLFLGTINGCILSNRVTPFGYTDLKCINDLLSMQNTNYFTATEAMLVVFVTSIFIIFCTYIFFKGPKFQGERKKILTPCLVALCFLMLPITTQAAQSSNILASYFANIAQGYENYGFVYGFSTSVVDRGMSKPKDYSEETVADAQNKSKKTATTNPDNPNIVVVLLESFLDPTEVNYLHFSEDPIPNFRKLTENYSSGYLTVPVVGAGTANTEFEILTGMSMQYFGTGEYPYKTILKQTDCESIASDLSKIGYGTHVVHNNGGNFYSRANAFSMMGFDSFTSKELMDIREYTPLGSWPTDDILIDETVKAMDATEGQPDFVYTITVQGHGDYPKEKVLPAPEILVSGAKDEATGYQWEYYVNMLHEVDKFIANLTAALEERGENTIVVFFGDHIPSLGLEETDLASGNTFLTQYATWNNFGLAKKDADLAAYELLASTTDALDIHEGTIFTYEQAAFEQHLQGTESYLEGLNHLQYDLLYGERYAYQGEDLYPATDLVMGVEDTSIVNMWPSASSDYVTISGKNFTKWSKIYVNGVKVPTIYINNARLRMSARDIQDGDTVVVNQMGSGNSVFRSTPEFVYDDPYVASTEQQPTE